MKKNCIERFRKAEQRKFKGECYEGESIEEKVTRITENNEPITDGAPIVYTKRSDGVLPQYDVRTDKWDLAQEKMTVVAESKKNKIKEKMNKGLPSKTEQPTEQQTENS